MSLPSENSENKDASLSELLVFLTRTRDGHYARIDESSLPYARIREQTEEVYLEDDCYYYTSIR